MGKPTGFVEWPRVPAPKREKKDRLHDFNEFTAPWPEDEARRQAGRCMDCGVPVCHQGCPLGNPIPDFNEHVFQGRWREAFIALSTTNNFPEFTGRLCPAPCESACTLAINQDPVAIEQVEKEIAERAFAHGWVRPRPVAARTGKKVAVVGSGPAGLAAAAQLNQAGHQVIVFERDDAIGGLLRYGIPDFKMEKWVIDRRVELMRTEGVQFRTGLDIGGAVSWTELRDTHDAVIIATGARRARELQVPGRELPGVVQAMAFLEAQNRASSAEATPVPDALSAKGRAVIILGGGDTGSDCLGTALRQGARSVRQLELLPPPPRERAADNPWPQWPNVFRTSSSQEEGGDRGFALSTKRLSGEGRVQKLHAVEVEPVVEGGRISLREREGSDVELEADLVVLAMGFTGPETSPLEQQLGLKTNARGNVQTDGSFATSVPGVYAVGDAARGASLIVWAISDGREAARAVDGFLRGAESHLPTRGVHLHFGGR